MTIKASVADIRPESGITNTDNKMTETIEQDFRVTKETKWKDMLEEVLEFWGIDRTKWDQFTLVLPNYHDIMSLNEEPNHMANSLSNFFEINRSKRAVLLLI